MPVDYSGHIPAVRRSTFLKAVEPPPVPNTTSFVQKLINQMLEENDIAREKILRNLIENPGVVATFGDDFIVEFAPMEINALESPEDRNLNEYRLEVSQKWRVRRRTEEDDRVSLGRDPGGEARSDR